MRIGSTWCVDHGGRVPDVQQHSRTAAESRHGRRVHGALRRARRCVVRGGEAATNSVGASQIKANGVGSSEVKNGSLGRSTSRRRTVPSGSPRAGPAGPEDADRGARPRRNEPQRHQRGRRRARHGGRGDHRCSSRRQPTWPTAPTPTTACSAPRASRRSAAAGVATTRCRRRRSSRTRGRRSQRRQHRAAAGGPGLHRLADHRRQPDRRRDLGHQAGGLGRLRRPADAPAVGKTPKDGSSPGRKTSAATAAIGVWSSQAEIGRRGRPMTEAVVGRSRTCAALAGACVAMSLSAAPASAASPRAQSAARSATTSLRALVRQTKGLPRAAATRTQRRALVRSARRARRTAARRPCTAVASLTRYRRTLARIRAPKGRAGRRPRPARAGLDGGEPAAARQTRHKSCGGGVKPSTLKTTRRPSSRATRTACACASSFRRCSSSTQTGGGKAWTQLVLQRTAERPAPPASPASRSSAAPSASRTARSCRSTTRQDRVLHARRCRRVPDPARRRGRRARHEVPNFQAGPVRRAAVHDRQGRATGALVRPPSPPSGQSWGHA